MDGLQWRRGMECDCGEGSGALRLRGFCGGGRISFDWFLRGGRGGEGGGLPVKCTS